MNEKIEKHLDRLEKTRRRLGLLRETAVSSPPLKSKT